MIKLDDVKEKAKIAGVSNPSSNKKELIRQIQQMEGYTACFKTKKACDQMNCCWREDCMKK